MRRKFFLGVGTEINLLDKEYFLLILRREKLLFYIEDFLGMSRRVKLLVVNEYYLLISRMEEFAIYDVSTSSLMHEQE